MELPLLEANGFLPDLDAVPAETGGGRAPLGQLPEQPDRRDRAARLLRAAAELAREHDFVLASDEAYTRALVRASRRVSALQLADWTNVAVFNTLSKRSSMTGYRSGFVAGDPELVAALKQFRPNVGTAPQEFVQRASVVAWGDEEHVERRAGAYARKRALFLDLFAREGLRVAGGPATMYLWVAVPDGETSEGFADAPARARRPRCARARSSAPSGEGYVRFALVPTEDECARAVEILERVL